MERVQHSAFPPPQDNGIPGPGAYLDVHPPFGRSRSAPMHRPRTEKPASRGMTQLPITVTQGVAVHGALPDNVERLWLRTAAQIAATQSMRSTRRREPKAQQNLYQVEAMMQKTAG